MTIVIRKNQDKEDIYALLKGLSPHKKFNAFKYCGKLQLSIDPLSFQKSLRNEWE